MDETGDPRPPDDRALPFAPVTLVLARDPLAVESQRAAAEALAALADAGKKEEAHRRGAPWLGDLGQRGAVAGFFLREVAGRRGARLLLRWLREDEDRRDGERVFAPRAAPAIEAWAQFRLLRHGRALGIAAEAIAALGRPGDGPADRRPDAALRDEARLWGQTLEAIRKSALRRGSLRLALHFHEQAQALERKHPGAQPEAQQARAAMTAVAYLLDRQSEHGLPATAARYLARSLGHDAGDSQTAYAELAGDLSLRPEHLNGALQVAARFGFHDRVTARLETVRGRLFRGHWRQRRAAQRAALIAVYALAVVAALVGFTLLTHLVAR
jgi:hypothetical protein